MSEISNEDIMKIIDNASEKSMDEEPEINLTEDARITKSAYKDDMVKKIIEGSTEEFVAKQQKEQADILSDEIKMRFARLKKISKDNFNMFEVAMLCHKLAADYRKLARLNSWKEIEAMFD
ncbi:MAG TPA: hypothetical protein PL048_01350 [Leptospiraceae bacterium]|nr:hypothetical protein [Leptospiraceae bacterium]HMY66541.1 hypothetical protein [Leptospiraceae bacterium]HMZ57387.1 hypothetical protein [Leptospiraceae bacterium]HNF14239.1 hypothetical protein [Leptospiraceae bacterium]HNF23034.1 hypothetical protein [Leptospiraceae bacterium]